MDFNVKSSPKTFRLLSLPLSSDKVIKILIKIGFQKIRQRGSHVFFRHPDGRKTVVPVHRGEELGRGMLRKIIKDVELIKEDFLELVKKL